MIDMRLKFSSKGYVVLTTSIVLLLVVTLIGLFTGQTLATEAKIQGNTYRALQAFNAAQAGLEYGINYAQTNASTITDGQVLTGTQANNSTYSVVLNFVGGNNNTLNVVSTGTSADGSATRVIKQLVKRAPISNTIPPTSVSSRGNVTLKNNAEVRNLTGTTTIVSGGIVDIKNNAQTVLSTGVSSTASSTQSDVVQNNSSLTAMSDTTLQSTYTGMALTSFQSMASNSYTGSGFGDYTTQLSGQTGKVIYIDQGGSGTIQTGNNITIGSATSPVIIVVIGNVALGNGVTLYGNIYATGDINTNNNGNLNGLIFATGNLTVGQNSTVTGAVVAGGTTTFAANNIVINYSSTVLNANNQAGNLYGKINGSWQDMNL